MKDILMPDEIRKAIEHPVLGNNHFGSWGILNRQQILSINNLLNILDSADALIKAQARKIKKQQNEIEKLKKPRYIYNAKSGEVTKLESNEELIKLQKENKKLKQLLTYCFEEGVIGE